MALPNLNINNSLSDLFSTEEQRIEQAQERIVSLRCSDIDTFRNHPYKVRDNAEMLDLVESIKSNGVIMPCIVRPSENGRYEMISGHRRRHAALLAGFDNIPAVVRDLDDTQATILMVDSNSQREVILPSEKAFAYKMRLDAMNRQGKRTDLTSAPLGSKLSGARSNIELASNVNESKTQIQRYIRLTELIPEFLQMVDNDVEKTDKGAFQMALRPAVELSYLTKENQRTVLEFIESSEVTPSHAQAIQLRKMQKDGMLTPQSVFALLSQEKPNQKEHISLSVEKLSRYFPSGTKPADMEKTIINALDYYRKAQEKAHQQQRMQK